MNLVERAKAILLSPKTEWPVIDNENDDPVKITTTYLLPLTMIGAVATFIGFGLIGMSLAPGLQYGSTGFGIKLAVSYIIRSIAGVFILAFVIDLLAPNFGSEKNFNKSFQLAAYSGTASLIAAALLILPLLALIVVLAAGIYGLYLAYIGLPVLKKTPQDKQTVYFVIIIVVTFIVNYILGSVERSLFYPKIGYNGFM